MKRRTLPFIAALVTVALMVALQSLNTRPTYVHQDVLEEPFHSTPPDFLRSGAREVSLQELIDIMAGDGATPDLPFQLPNDLELTAIYLKDSPFIGVVVYDSQGNKDPATAEIVIQITASEPPSQRELEEHYSGEFKHFLKINGWYVAINERARVTRPEKRAKYGDWTLVANVWIDGINYAIGAPTLTVEQLNALIQSMRPVEI